MSLNKKNAKYYYDEVQKLLDKQRVEGVVNWGAVCLEVPLKLMNQENTRFT